MRSDISDKLVHFTSPRDNLEEAYSRLKSIISEGCIRGGNGKIRDEYFCVCFTEAPLPALPGGLVNSNNYRRYAPFGVLLDKKTIFEKGGRPVFYQSEVEYGLLPESFRWRHVRYEPTSNPPIDFSWEREWRINCKELILHPNEAALIVPNQSWANRLFQEHEYEQNYQIGMYSLVLDSFIAEQYREDFPWRVYPLANQGA
jgi:hypothetical protein